MNKFFGKKLIGLYWAVMTLFPLNLNQSGSEPAQTAAPCQLIFS